MTLNAVMNRAVRRTFKMQDETKSPFIAGHFSERTWENMWRETSARVERLEAALLNIYQVWQMRSELFTNDEDCAASLADRARLAALGDAIETKEG